MSHSDTDSTSRADQQHRVIALVSDTGAVVNTFDTLESAHQRREYLARVSPHVTETDYMVRHVTPASDDTAFIDIETGRTYPDET